MGGRAGDGCTPLCMAAQNGHLEIVRHLVGEARADVNQGQRTLVALLCSWLHRMDTWRSSGTWGRLVPTFTRAQWTMIALLCSWLHRRDTWRSSGTWSGRLVRTLTGAER